MTVTPKDRETLRTLAARYMTYALSEKNIEKRELWRALNRLQMQRPVISIEQMPWHELDVDGSLVCTMEDPYFRGIEWEMRTQIYKWEHMPADMVLNPYITLPRPIHNTGFGMTTQHVEPNRPGIQIHLFEDQLAEQEDVQKIKTPHLTLDTAREEELIAAAKDIFAGIAPIRLGGIMLHAGLWDQITFWKGVENCYIDLLDRPELIHAIMDHYTTAFLAQLDQINALGAYDVTSNICHCSYTFGEGEEETERPYATSHDAWTFSMAQLFTSVSPAINEEFEVPYMTRIFSRFKSVYYGCCERLDDRLDIIDRMPNIRKISCSPWSDREHFAAVLPKKYIMSNKPNPSYLAQTSFDEDVVRADLRRTVTAAKENGLCLELLLKDITTVCGDPRRLWRWSEIAVEECENAAL